MPTTSPLVPRVPVVPSGPELSRIVYGTWRLLADADAATPERLCRRLELAADLGITTIDTAEVYGGYDVEERIGAALRLAPGLRQRLQIVTKFGIYVPNARHPERKVAFYDATAVLMQKSAEKSLRLLGTDHLDVLLVHRPDWLTAADDTADGFDRLLRDGKIRAAGVSNYTPSQLELLAERMGARGRSLVTNQIELSLFAMSALTDGSTDLCQRMRMRPMAWSPLGGGRLFRDGDVAAERVRAAMTAMAGRYADPETGAPATAEQLAYAWITAHPSGPVVVIGTNREDRLAGAARAANIQLERADWFALWEAAQGRRIP